MATRSILVVLAAITLASCEAGQAEEPQIQTYQFERGDSPQVTEWSNGIIFASCPVGYHFEQISDWRNQQRMKCEPNPAPDDNE